MMNLKSMELSEDESYDAPMPIPMKDRPQFPYGLQICITQDEMEKLGIDPSEAVVGSTFMLHAMARVTSISATDNEMMGQTFRMEAQIEQMDVDGEDPEEVAAMPKRSLASIYKST